MHLKTAESVEITVMPTPNNISNERLTSNAIGDIKHKKYYTPSSNYPVKVFSLSTHPQHVNDVSTNHGAIVFDYKRQGTTSRFGIDSR